MVHFWCIYINVMCHEFTNESYSSKYLIRLIGLLNSSRRLTIHPHCVAKTTEGVRRQRHRSEKRDSAKERRNKKIRSRASAARIRAELTQIVAVQLGFTTRLTRTCYVTLTPVRITRLVEISKQISLTS